MNVATLVDQIATGSKVQFSGDKAASFFGLSFRVANRVRPGHFLVLVDESWGKRTVAKFAPKNLESHIRRARSSGIEGFICNSSLAASPALRGANVISANDTLPLAYRIAEVMRDNRGDDLITAITGSAGKSTTKSMLTHALRSTAEYSVQSPPHGQNIFPSLISHYSSLGQADHSVVEVAGSCFSPFRSNAFNLAADVSIVTGIAEAHVDYLGGLKGIAQSKSDIFNGSTPGGTAVINAEAPHADLLIQRATEEGRQLVTYGERENLTIQLESYEPSSHLVAARIGGERLTYSLGAPGRHMALNSLAVLATLRAYRIPKWREMLDSLATFSALPGRGIAFTATVRAGVEITVIDDAYNANPASMRSALAMLADTEPDESGSRVAVLGDMLELGRNASDLHKDLTTAVLNSKAERVHLFGEAMETLYEQLRDRIDVHYWRDLETLTAALIDEVNAGDVLLVKSSRGTGMHSVVDALKAADLFPQYTS